MASRFKAVSIKFSPFTVLLEDPEIFITSAEKKKGIHEIVKYIGRLNPQFKECI